VSFPYKEYALHLLRRKLNELGAIYYSVWRKGPYLCMTLDTLHEELPESKRGFVKVEFENVDGHRRDIRGILSRAKPENVVDVEFALFLSHNGSNALRIKIFDDLFIIPTRKIPHATIYIASSPEILSSMVPISVSFSLREEDIDTLAETLAKLV